MNDTLSAKEARRRARALREFYAHLTVYVIMNVLFFTIDVLTPGKMWFYWPLIGWGIGIAFHGVSVFASSRLFGEEWEERKFQEYRSSEHRAHHV